MHVEKCPTESLHQRPPPCPDSWSRSTVCASESRLPSAGCELSVQETETRARQGVTSSGGTCDVLSSFLPSLLSFLCGLCGVALFFLIG